MDGTETRQRRPEELGLLHGLSTGRLPEASEDGLLSVPESQRVAPKPLGPELSRETTLSIGLQVTVPFLFAGLGLSGAGILLNYFQHWPVFTEVKDLLTLVPPLVGLKGNLEMTLASRLSTAANTGQIDGPREQHRVISSNLALIQVQAAVMGLLAAVAALLLGAASGQELDAAEAEVLCASSVITAFLAACALGTLMVCIVIGARKLGVNPDNIATPIAASLGDLITLSILAFVSSFFHKHRDSRYLTPLVCIGFTALTPLCILIAKQNPPVVKILKFGWFPIVLAMLVSSFGGLILNKTISKQQFRGMAVFAPIICGVGGNLVAIQTSRISTYLHLWSTPGVLPLWMKKRWPNPRSTFCSSGGSGVFQRPRGRFFKNLVSVAADPSAQPRRANVAFTGPFAQPEAHRPSPGTVRDGGADPTPGDRHAPAEQTHTGFQVVLCAEGPRKGWREASLLRTSGGGGLGRGPEGQALVLLGLKVEEGPQSLF
ncbi:solute carrier family 41 member 3 isoform X3 [Tursiops truncatus]|uniref:Solute carrier family 41 member n=1 Tax=Tursiops truncatus TaxID=9739 RepID=A0A6J3S3S7_TURTR|nr:solute carrier family 41 member 3 isoform X3 [Tursiops truncatus]XP_033721488.1 solute carrier family 41 member 3 isoform X3 [Tursiops truncatus]XP_033721489.1 solute carrier family 41 member 3 isoform X3 [Tursiops truncatus]